MANILELIQSNDMLKVALILLGVYLLLSYRKRSESMENYYGMMPEQLENVEGEAAQPEVAQAAKEPKMAQPETPMISQEVVQPQVQAEQIDKIVAGSDKITPEDLLPKYDEENAFAKENPVSKLLKEQNFLISGYHVGINTVMQSNKIPYHDIRSLPPIPKENVGPWNQSSFEHGPAQMRRFFEIGV